MAILEAENVGVHLSDIGGPSEDWRELGPGLEARVLRTCSVTGTWAVLYKVAGGTSASAHVHYGSADSYVISGCMETGGGEANGGRTVRAGSYSFEPNSNRRHEATYFAEDTLLIYIHHGPIMYVDDDGGFKHLLDWQGVRAIAEGKI